MSETFELDPLPLTGERTVPDVAKENYWFRRHETVYHWLLGWCRDETVLEAGSGEGYGADLIAEHAEHVVAVDYDAQAIAHTQLKYPRVAAVRSNLAGLPLRSKSVGVVVNLQVIEHLWDQVGFLRECRRVLRDGGRLVVSTPNRFTFSPGRDTPLNPFHTREFAPRELADDLSEAGFGQVEPFGVYHGDRLRELDAKFPGGLVGAQTELALSGEAWPKDLTDAVTSVTAADFEIRPSSQLSDLDDSLDLVFAGVRR